MSCLKRMIVATLTALALPMAAGANPACPALDVSEFNGVSSKAEMEEAIAALIIRASVDERHVDWDCLSFNFDSLGDDFSAERYQGGGFAGGDIIRFTFDRSTLLNWLVGVPGASNGVYTAVVNIATDGRTAIVRRGGRLDWLD